MRRIIVVMAAVLMAVAWSGTRAEVAPGQPAPDFALQDQDGNTVRLSDFKDQIVVLEWFNNECPFVVRHYDAKTMSALASEYADKGVVWLAINSTKGKSNADNKAIAGKWDIAFPILNDASGEIGHKYGAKTTPDMRIIQNGKLVYVGAIDDDPSGKKEPKVNYVQKALEELLAGTNVSVAQTKPYGCSVKYAK